LPKGALLEILKQAGISREEALALLEKRKKKGLPKTVSRGASTQHMSSFIKILFKEIQKGYESCKEGKPYSDQPLKKG